MADIIFNKFGEGMGESALTGFGEMRNVDIYSSPGAVKTNNKLQLVSQAPQANFTFTADPATDILDYGITHNLRNGAAVTVSTTGTLPAPLTINTTYYVIFVSSTTIKLATNIANAQASTAIDITTTGTGSNSSTTINMSRIRFFAEDPKSNYVYCVDDNGRVWYVGDFNTLWVLIDGNTRTNASGNGICVWKDYLLVFRNALIDLYGGPAGGLSDAIGNRVWNGPVGWPLSSTNTSNSHHAIWGIDDILYYCDKNKVSSFQEVGTFTGIAGTYTQTMGALSLPSSYNSFRLEELGQNLMVAANIGSGNFTSTIFPWDRTSSSFFLPLRLPFQIDNFFVYDNVLYVYSAKMMKIYATNGSSFNELKRLPPIATLNDISFNTAIGGVGAYLGRLFFTLFGRTGYVGLFSLNLNNGEYNREGALVFENIFSINSTSSTVFSFGMHVPRGAGNLFAAWYDSSLGYGGIDSYLGPNTAYVRYSNYEVSVETELTKVGTPLEKRTLEQIEIDLAKPLTINQGVRLSYRTDLNASYTLINTYDTSAGFGNYQTLTESEKLGVTTDYIQVKVDLTSNSSSTTSPELIQIRIR